ncbi:LOW QUALITY PROTEIN: hypothetical protein HID58_010954, partial [Brassica napus]
REKREARSTPAYGRRVSVRAVAGALFSFLVCVLYRSLFTDPSSVCLVGALKPRFSIRGESVLEVAVEMERRACCSRSTREMEANLDPSSPVLSRGWRLSQFYRRRSSSREEEAQSAPSLPVFGHGGWRLTKLHAAVVESQVSGGSRRACLGFPVVYRRKRSRFKRLNSPTGRQGVEEVRWRGGSVGAELRRKRCDGGKRRWLCEDGGSKLRRATRGGRMSQILTRVRLCLLPARPE